jgi:UDP-N-acetylglucosamine 2-epimerase (non-hydrolysing)
MLIMKKILVVFGTRPEAIKMAPLVLKLKEYPDIFNTKVCITAQHRQMLDQVMKIFDIKADYDLDLMKPNQDLFDLTARIVTGMRGVLQEFKPDLVLVHGDTSTSTMAALASFYSQITVGHIEAGLRTHNIYSPWPEEMNRQITGRIAQVHFAPTAIAKSNLLAEGVAESKIVVTGNTVIDALFLALEKLKTNKDLANTIIADLKERGLKNIEQLLAENKKIVLVTGHRRENFGDGFLNICNALKKFAMDYPDYQVIYPVHLNPNVQKPVFEILQGVSNISLIDPLEYLSFIFLMEKARIVLTDSGGIQEEAPSLGKPVLVMRDTTERPEAVTAGTVKLVGTSAEAIYYNLKLLINSEEEYNNMSRAINPYGDGMACQRIVEHLKNN